MGAAWPHKLVFRVKRRLKSIFSCNQKTAIKRKHKTATQHSGRDLERRSKGAGRWRYFVPQAQNNAGTKRTLLRRDKMLQYRYFKFSIGYLEDHPTALLGRGAFAPHECFAAGKTSAQGEFISPEQFKGPQVSKKEAPAMQVLLFCHVLTKKMQPKNRKAARRVTNKLQVSVVYHSRKRRDSLSGYEISPQGMEAGNF